jgi:hypothetical protein
MSSADEGDITERKDAEVEHEQLVVCASCKRISDGQGDWKRSEIDTLDRSMADVTHGCCPDCLEKLYNKS